jgi:hypothetical protein
MLVPGLRNFLGMTSIGLMDAAVIGAGTAFSFVINEITKKGKKTKDIEGVSLTKEEMGHADVLRMGA